MAYIDSDRTTKLTVAIFTLVFFVAAFVVKEFDGGPAALVDSPSHYIALLINCVLMWIAGIYCIYLVANSMGTGSFPGPKAKLPVRSRLVFGAMAIAYRGVMIVAAAFLMVFPVLAIRYVNGF